MSYGGENSPDILEKRVASYQLDSHLQIIKESRQIFKSLSEAERQLSTESKRINASYISQICHGKKYSVFNYTFCFIDDNGNDIPTGYQGLKGSVAASKENIKKCHKANSTAIVVINDNAQKCFLAV